MGDGVTYKQTRRRRARSLFVDCRPSEASAVTLKTKAQATYADIEALPTGWVGELVSGTLYGHPRPTVGHAEVESSLAALLKGPFDHGVNGPGGWWILVEPELHLGRDVIVPDLAAWRKERIPRQPDPSEPFITLPPDWVCEILSPSTERVDRFKKLPRYHEVGVAHLWLVNPADRTLEIFEREDRGYLRTGGYEGDAEIREAPFDALPLPLNRLWLRP